MHKYTYTYIQLGIHICIISRINTCTVVMRGEFTYIALDTRQLRKVTGVLM